MGAGDILAGRAAVEIVGDYAKLKKSLSGALSAVKSFASSASASLSKINPHIQTISKGMLGAGLAIKTGLGLSLKLFESTGSALMDMSQRTGMAANQIAGLGYAASQTGSDAGSLEIAIRAMQRVLGKTKQLSGKGTYEQFISVASAISAIKNPSERAARAMQMFGKSGTAILPMLSEGISGLRKMIAEAEDLGIVMSDASVKAADDFGDAMTRLKNAFRGVAISVGGIIAPGITKIVDLVSRITVAMRMWIDAHPGLVKELSRLSGWLIAVGGGIYLVTAHWGKLLSLGIIAWLANATGLMGSLTESIRAQYPELSKLLDAGASIASKFADAWDTAIQAIKWSFQSMWESIKSMTFMALQLMKEAILGTLGDAMLKFGNSMAQAGEKMSKSNPLRETIIAAGSGINSIGFEMKQSALRDKWDRGNTTLGGMSKEAEKNAGRYGTAAAEYFDKAKRQAMGAAQGVIGLLPQIGQREADIPKPSPFSFTRIESQKREAKKRELGIGQGGVTGFFGWQGARGQMGQSIAKTQVSIARTQLNVLQSIDKKIGGGAVLA